MNRVNPPSSVLRVVKQGWRVETKGGEGYVEITAPVAERLSLNASDCCFIKRKRNRFSDAECNRGANTAPANWAVCRCISRDFLPPLQLAGLRTVVDTLVSSFLTKRASRNFYEGQDRLRNDFEDGTNSQTNSPCHTVRVERDREWFRNHRDESVIPTIPRGRERSRIYTFQDTFRSQPSKYPWKCNQLTKSVWSLNFTFFNQNFPLFSALFLPEPIVIRGHRK